MRTILILSLFLCGSITVKSQYHPLLSNTNWNVLFLQYQEDSIQLLNDTTINGVQYTLCSSARNFFNYALREDTSQKKVWLLDYYYDKDSAEWLLYDFSLNKGDSIRLRYNQFFIRETSLFKVDSVYEEVIEGENRKILLIQGVDVLRKDKWIEGIGSTIGLLSLQTSFLFLTPPLPCSEYNSALLCVHKNSSLVYHNKCFNGCRYNTVSTNEVSKDRDTYLVYPNPFNDLLYITPQALGSNPIEYIMMSVTGRVVSKGQLENATIPIPQHMQAGIYFLVLKPQNKDSIYFKLIKL